MGTPVRLCWVKSRQSGFTWEIEIRVSNSLTVRRATVAAATLVLLAGCSGGAAEKPDPADVLAVPPPSPAAIATLASTNGLTLPTEAYVPTAEEQNLINNAEIKLIVDCMNKYGFAYPAVPSNVTAKRQADRLYGVGELATAQKYGFHVPSKTEGGSNSGHPIGGSDTGTSAPQRTSSAAELLVLSGSADGTSENDKPGDYQGKAIPVGGCAGDARRVVTGVDEIDPTKLAESLTVAMWQKSASDSRVVDVISKWAACMKESGYNYASPMEAGADHPEWTRARYPNQAEIQAAVTDVTCKQKTNLIGLWFTIEKGYEEAAIQKQIQELTHIKESWTAAARKAAQILSVPAPR
jgi:hypothetical protein